MDAQPRARGRGAAAVVDVAAGGDALCDYGLECLLTIIRTLRMGSCLSSAASDASSTAAAFSGRSSRSKKQQQITRRGAARKDEAAARSASLEAMRRIPGRMFSNGASGIASMFTQQGKKGTNQDAMIVWENFCARSDTIFCGVFDGHGPFGHVVARRVRDSLPLKLSSHLEVEVGNICFKENNNLSKAGSMNSEESSSLNLEEKSGVSVDLKQKENHSDILMGFKRSFLKAFKVVDKELEVHPNIDCFFSGTTAVTLLKQGQDLVIGNVGDSRAIMGTRDQNDRLVAVQLTVDLKPNLPREAERIRRCKGRVFALRDEPKVARLWLPNNNAPGLSMARAFGDFCLKDFGLISVPEVSYRRITEKDEFIVLATDGVWDVLSNEQVVTIVASAPDRSNASHAIVNAAIRSWRIKHPTSKIDDCAVVCLFLNTEENVSSTKESCNGWSLNSTEAGKNTALDPSNPTSVERSTTIRSSRILQQHNINTS